MKFGLQPMRAERSQAWQHLRPVEIRQRTRFEIVIAGKDVQCQLKARCRVGYFLKLFGRCMIGVVAQKHREIDTVEEILISILDQLRKDFGLPQPLLPQRRTSRVCAEGTMTSRDIGRETTPAADAAMRKAAAAANDAFSRASDASSSG
jgi:hypothetical protein